MSAIADMRWLASLAPQDEAVRVAGRNRFIAPFRGQALNKMAQCASLIATTVLYQRITLVLNLPVNGQAESTFASRVVQLAG